MVRSPRRLPTHRHPWQSVALEALDQSRREPCGSRHSLTRPSFARLRNFSALTSRSRPALPRRLSQRRQVRPNAAPGRRQEKQASDCTCSWIIALAPPQPRPAPSLPPPPASFFGAQRGLRVAFVRHSLEESLSRDALPRASKSAAAPQRSTRGAHRHVGYTSPVLSPDFS